jgi:uncharacterized protein (DUF1778 family)
MKLNANAARAERFELRVTAEERRLVQAIAERAGTTASELLRLLVAREARRLDRQGLEGRASKG